MKDNNLVKNDFSMDTIKADAEDSLSKFEKIVDEEIAKISTFTEDNLDELLKMIFDDCQDLTELEEYTNIIKKRIIDSQNQKEQLKYQLTLTKKDIIEENIINIYLIYNAVIAAIWISSPDMLYFIKNFLITALISVSTFDINLRYFTSNHRKNKAKRTIDILDKNIEISKYDVNTFNKFREMYIKELTFQVKKLFEIMNNNSNNQNNYQRIEKLLDDLKIEFLLEDKSIKTKIRKR